MADERMDLRNLEFREFFPWFHLFRGFRLALDIKKIVLGATGAFVMAFGWWLIAGMFIGQMPVQPELPSNADATQKAQWEQDALAWSSASQRYAALDQARTFPWEENAAGSQLYRPGDWKSAWLVAQPLRQLTFPAQVIFQSSSATLAGSLLTVWTLLVWGLFGGAITRIAAVQVARDGHVGFWESLRFAGSRFFAYLGGPVFPFVGVVVIVLLSALGGLLIHLPVVNIVVGALWFLPLLAGFVMVVALFCLAVGWPLMYAAVSAEATESFDALSRAFSYVITRPWQYLLYILGAALYGGVIMIVAVLATYGTIYLSQYSISWGGWDEGLRDLYAYVPVAGGWRSSFGPGAAMPGPAGTEYMTAVLIGIWTHLLFMGLVGFTYSYFWSATTIIYFLLRKDVDETEIEEVYLEEEEEEPFPTVAPSLVPTPSGEGPMGNSLPIIDPPRQG